MNTQYRIFVKFLGELPQGKTDRVVHTEDVNAADVYATMRRLEGQFPPSTHGFTSKVRDPLNM
jgi:hypothetical protein